MARPKKTEQVVDTEIADVTPNDIGWTDHVLALLEDDERIMGNPTTDGLRRVFEIALDCTIISA